MSNIIDSIQVSGTVYQIQGSGGNPTVELTQEQYDALVSAGTVSPTTYYIITDAEAVDMTNYYTKSQTSGATQISTALNGKQATLVSGTNIKTINNESILGGGNITIQGGGGGKAVSAGTNISITTGETADTINCTLPITVSKNGNQNEITFNNVAKFNVRGYASGAYAVAIGEQTTSYGSYAIAIGHGARTNVNFSNAFGYYSIANNQREFSTGSYNNSVTATTTFGDSGNTLFSVGNGTANNARHNAFEIRQNGDIYINKDGQDVKLQDQLGGGAASSAITSGDTNAVAGGAVYDRFDEVEQVTAAALNALNNNFGGLKLVKLTQAEYTALTTKDSQTLYIVTDS